MRSLRKQACTSPVTARLRSGYRPPAWYVRRTDAALEFRILGPLEVLAQGRRLALGGAQQRAVLAMLLLHPNEVVANDRLVDAIWGERAPRTAPKALQVRVSRLRKLLEPERGSHRVLLTRPPGYLLRVGRGQLDLERFEALLSRGREALLAGDPTEAGDKLRRALELWRGPPLADLTYESFAQAEIARLEELRLEALEERVEADLALGRHAALVGELESLVAQNPLRERLRGQLMLALHRSGRQAEALAAYREARRTLVDELGLVPGEALRRLEGRILAQDPSLEAPTPPERRRAPDGKPRPSGAGVFVGREHELEQLDAGLDALRGRGGLFLLSGEPGIGKSRLADELATRAKSSGATVLVGRCWEAGGAPAYWPWVQAIRGYVRERGPDTLRAQLGSGAPALAQMVPDLREILPDLPAPPPLDPEGARFRLFDATASFLRNAAAVRALLIVLDDLHAADIPSLLLLQFVACELADSRILIVAGYRDVDPTLDEPLVSTLAELAREPVTRHLALGGLAKSEVASFIEQSTGMEAPEAVVAAIHAETEGNPLFVGEVVRLLAVEGRLTEMGGEAQRRLAVPQGVRAVIGRRLRGLSAECKRALTLASVLGREFRLDALERVSELSREQLLEALEEAIVARVVAEVPGTRHRLRFSHALVRDTLYDELGPASRIRLHRRVGEALETLHSKDPEPHLAELAHHFYEGAPGGDVARAIDYARRAGDRAAALLAYEEAVRLYRLALEALELGDARDEQTRCELLLGLGDSLARAGDGPGARESFRQAAELARRHLLSEQLARAALGYGGRFVWPRAGTDERLVPLLEDGLRALGEADSPLRVRLLARLAGALRDRPTREVGAALSQEAVEMARRLGDPGTLCHALDGRCASLLWPENPEERVALATELARLGDEARDLEKAVQGRYYKTMALLELGQMSAVRAELDAIDRLAEELGQPAQRWILVATRATLALFEGRFQEAEPLIAEALRLGQRAQSSDALLSYRIQLFTLRRERGELEELEALLERSIDEYPARPMFRCMLALLYADLAREQEARAILEELAADDFAALPRTNEWLFSLGFLAEIASHLGDTGGARSMYGLLLPYASRNACTADYISTGSVSRPLGILASTTARWDRAVTHFEDALAMNSQMGARPWVGRTELEFARALVARREAGDSEAARELLHRCLHGFRELGMRHCAEKASALEEVLSLRARS